MTMNMAMTMTTTPIYSGSGRDSLHNANNATSICHKSRYATLRSWQGGVASCWRVVGTVASASGQRHRDGGRIMTAVWGMAVTESRQSSVDRMYPVVARRTRRGLCNPEHGGGGPFAGHKMVFGPSWG